MRRSCHPFRRLRCEVNMFTFPSSKRPECTGYKVLQKTAPELWRNKVDFARRRECSRIRVTVKIDNREQIPDGKSIDKRRGRLRIVRWAIKSSVFPHTIAIDCITPRFLAFTSCPVSIRACTGVVCFSEKRKKKLRFYRNRAPYTCVRVSVRFRCSSVCCSFVCRRPFTVHATVPRRVRRV